VGRAQIFQDVILRPGNFFFDAGPQVFGFGHGRPKKTFADVKLHVGNFEDGTHEILPVGLHHALQSRSKSPMPDIGHHGQLTIARLGLCLARLAVPDARL